MKPKQAVPYCVRQGDVLLVDAAYRGGMPKGASPIAPEKKGVVLAHGEVTGHAHALKERKKVAYFDAAGERYLQIVEKTALTHEEHSAVQLRDGVLQQAFQVEDFGCALVSPGCTNCYAMRQAHRHANKGGAYEGLTKTSKGGPVWTGKVRTVPELLDWPLRRRNPLRIFVNSMSDLFHEDVPSDFIEAVFHRMAMAPRHTFQILTKRAERMRNFMTGGRAFKDPLPNVWLGVSVEDQARADERIPLLLQTPAAVRWISAEPLLGPVRVDDLADGAGGVLKPLCGLHWEPCLDREGKPGLTVKKPKGARIDWVVVGGESGPGARAMHPDWARSLRDHCSAVGVAYFFKQWGAWAPTGNPPILMEAPGVVQMQLIGKKTAGRLLDGRTHDEYPR